MKTILTITFGALALSAMFLWGLDVGVKVGKTRDIQTLRDTFKAGARASEVHHAETAHYPDDAWLDSMIEAFEKGEGKKFLDDFVSGRTTGLPESRGGVFSPPEGQDSGKESGRL